LRPFRHCLYVAPEKPPLIHLFLPITFYSTAHLLHLGAVVQKRASTERFVQHGIPTADGTKVEEVSSGINVREGTSETMQGGGIRSGGLRRESQAVTLAGVTIIDKCCNRGARPFEDADPSSLSTPSWVILPVGFLVQAYRFSDQEVKDRKVLGPEGWLSQARKRTAEGTKRAEWVQASPKKEERLWTVSSCDAQ